MSVRLVEPWNSGEVRVVERRVRRKSDLLAREDIVVWKKDTVDYLDHCHYSGIPSGPGPKGLKARAEANHSAH
jgi:hypothetical protein